MATKRNLKLVGISLATIVIFLFLISVFVNIKMTLEKQASTPTLQTSEMITMDIVSFSQINESPVRYKGTAMTCNALGGCDSINFTSDKKPEMGPATFIHWYNSDGSIGGWLFVEMSLVL